MRNKQVSPTSTAQPLVLNPLERYAIDDAAALLRVSRSTVYADIARGVIATIQHGRRRYVPGSEIARLSALPPAAR